MRLSKRVFPRASHRTYARADTERGPVGCFLPSVCLLCVKSKVPAYLHNLHTPYLADAGDEGARGRAIVAFLEDVVQGLGRVPAPDLDYHMQQRNNAVQYNAEYFAKLLYARGKIGSTSLKSIACLLRSTKRRQTAYNRDCCILHLVRLGGLPPPVGTHVCGVDVDVATVAHDPVPLLHRTAELELRQKSSGGEETQAGRKQERLAYSRLETEKIKQQNEGSR